MSSKNSIKTYIRDGFYHIYNRGVEKRNIFEDSQDYMVFTKYLEQYLSFKNTEALLKKLQNKDLPWSEKNKILRLIKLNNFHDEIHLLAYCLMPNHFHLLIKQSHEYSMDHFINSLLTRYAMYFNKRHRRIGTLFQDVYKAVSVKTDEQLLYLSAYIHRNPLTQTQREHKGDVVRFAINQPSSLPEYLNLKETSWIKTEIVLSYFLKTNPRKAYRNFVFQKDTSSIISKLFIEKD